MEPAQAFNEQWRYLPDTHAQVISDGKWHPYPNLVRVSEEIVLARRQGGGCIIVNLPPRHGKSEFISYHVPTWFLDNWPSERVILSMHSADVARIYGRRVRNALLGNSKVITAVAEDSQAADQWDTPQGGGMTAAGIGGSITGKGGNFIIVDDPVKNWEDADSEVIQQRNVEWFKTTLWTRREPGAVVVVLMTRWHRKDLAGFLLSKELQEELHTKFVHLRFPALAEKQDPLGREPGAALCPERYNEQALAEIRAVEGSRHWSGLYQQSPVDTENATIKQHWLQYFENRPTPSRAYITIDQAYSSKKTADYTVLMTTLVDSEGNLYVWEYIRSRMSVANFLNALFDLVERTVGLDSVGIEIPPGETEENSSILLLIRQEMRNRGVFFVLKPFRPSKDKVSRATKFVGLLSNGKVYLRRRMSELEDELLAFPTGDHDDLIDTLSLVTMIMAPAKKEGGQHPRPPSPMSA